MKDNSLLDVLLVSAPSPHATAIISHRMQGLPPLGLGYIATYLNKNNYRAKILDMNLASVSVKHLKSVLEELRPPMVGISTTTETYKCGIKIAKYIKEYDSSIIVFMGGCHVTYEYEAALDTGYLNFVSRNEGEITTLEACDYYIKNKGQLDEINGISYLSNGQVISTKDREFIKNLDELPYPDRSLFQMSEYGVPASISTSRGCPGKCIFCAASRLSGGRYRTRSAQSILEEFKYLKSLGYNHVQIVDDTMTADVRRLNRFIDLMLTEQLGMTWNCESRVDIINRELLERMKNAGCLSLQFGVEAGSQRMLDYLKKNITMEQIRNAFVGCKEMGITTASCLIIGQPYDTPESVEETIQFAKELQALGARIVFSISTPYPGTYMYDHAEELGLEIVDWDTDNYTTLMPIYNSRYITAMQMRTYYYDAYMSLTQSADIPDSIRQYWKRVKNRGEVSMANDYS
jgi:radical SAM superfamily enzyme YgiQ (UPF0313 family)